MTQYQHILLEPHGAVMVVRLNRPQVLNALNAPMVAEIAAALEGIARDANLRCVVLT
jgi:enoyl-CoA hydratase/carnithine racemase